MLVLSSVSVGDPAASEVVCGQLDLHFVAGQDADVVLSQHPGDGGKHIVTAVDLHPKHCARERFDDLALDLDLLFLGYYLPPSEPSEKPRSPSAVMTTRTQQSAASGRA
jgi:hypothetical protein